MLHLSSFHHKDTGELIKWEPGDHDRPVKIDGQKLLRLVGKVATSALLAHLYPEEGSKGRHEAAQAIGGWLARNGWEEGEVKIFAEAVATGSQQTAGKKKEIIRTARDATQAYQDEKKAFGRKKMEKIFGQVAITKVTEWLGFKEMSKSETLEEVLNKPSDEASRVFNPTPYAFPAETDIPMRAWVWDKHYIRMFVSATLAAGGVGKSNHVLVECVMMAKKKKLRVWYFGEAHLDEIQRLITGILKNYQIKKEELDDLLLVDSMYNIPIKVGIMERNTIVYRDAAALQETLRTRNIDVFVADHFIKIHGVPENDNTAIDAVVTCLSHIAQKLNCSIEVVHHTRKPSIGRVEITADDSRGAGTLVNSCRSVRLLNPMNKKEAAEALVEEKERKKIYRVDNGKVNMTPPTENTRWFKKISIYLQNNPKGKKVKGDDIGVATKWELKGVLETVEAGDLGKVQDEIDHCEWGADNRSDDWVGYAVASALQLDLENPMHKKKVTKLLAIWLKTGVLKKLNNQPSPTTSGRFRTEVITGRLKKHKILLAQQAKKEKQKKQQKPRKKRFKSCSSHFVEKSLKKA